MTAGRSDLSTGVACSTHTVLPCQGVKAESEEQVVVCSPRAHSSPNLRSDFDARVWATCWTATCFRPVQAARDTACPRYLHAWGWAKHVLKICAQSSPQNACKVSDFVSGFSTRALHHQTLLHYLVTTFSLPLSRASTRAQPTTT